MFKNLFKFKNLKNTKFEIIIYINIKLTKNLIFLIIKDRKTFNQSK